MMQVLIWRRGTTVVSGSLRQAEMGTRRDNHGVSE